MPPGKPQTKQVMAFVKADSIDREAGTLEAFATTRSRDRDGDIVAPHGVDVKAFRANPVILATHMHRSLTGHPTVIGSATRIRKTKEGILFKMAWASTPLAMEYRGLYEEGHMRAFSIGFIPVKVKELDIDEVRKEEPDLPPHVRFPREFSKTELLEISAVPVPSNRDALVAAYGGDGRDTHYLTQLAVAEMMGALEERQDRPPTTVQTLIMSKDRFETAEEAKKWATDHDFKASKVDETDNSFRLRQRDPGDFKEGSLKTIELDEGVAAVIGRLKKDGENLGDEKALLGALAEVAENVAEAALGMREAAAEIREMVEELRDDREDEDILGTGKNGDRDNDRVTGVLAGATAAIERLAGIGSPSEGD